MATTNSIENMNGSLRRIARNVKRWKDESMIRRRVGTACVVGSSRNKHEPDSGTLPTIGYTTPTELEDSVLHFACWALFDAVV